MRCICPSRGWSGYQTQALWRKPARRNGLCSSTTWLWGVGRREWRQLPSVITFRLRNMHPDRVNGALHRILSQHGEALEQGAMISVTEGQVRVRRLPLSP
jgi:hypothetical protein